MAKRRRGRPIKTTYTRAPIRRRVGRHRKRRSIIQKQRDNNLFSTLSPETKKGIFVFTLLIIGFLSFLALFDLSGALGRYIVKGMKLVFGWLYFLVPFIFVILGFLLLNPRKYVIKTRHYVGLLLFLLTTTGLLNLIVGFNEIIEKIKLGQGGGYFGMVFYYPFYKLAGFWGTSVLLLGLFVVSVLLTFELSIPDLNIFNKLRESIRLKKRRIDDQAEFDKLIEEEDEYINEDDIYEEDSFEEDESSFTEDLEDKGKESAEDVKDKGSKVRHRKIYKNIQIPLDLLDDNHSKPTSYDIENNKERIKKTLYNFGMEVEMGKVSVGPTFTQFTLKPSEGIRLSKIVSLQNNLSLSLAAHPIRIEAPIPGRSLVGIEVPNRIVSIVHLKEILSSDKFQRPGGHLKFALGKDVAGNNKVVDLAKMPHLLIAGATGSGKTVCINSLIISLLYKLNPNQLKLILIDPKQVELSPYNGIPHLLTPVITKVDKTVNALKWAIVEMERRYDLLHSANTGDIYDIYSYNNYISDPNDKMSNIIIIIDELADLMVVNPIDVETSIIRLAQKARAVGIHLVLATQRPSVNVVTGLIKTNITSRIAFTVASQIDSRTIIDIAGAEKLLGNGDMLYISAEISKPRRFQGIFVSGQEKKRIINFLKKQAEPDYLEEVTETPSRSIPGFISSHDNDSLLVEARAIVTKYDKASATLLQRILRVGYARAARILDQLEDMGIVGPANGPKPRDVLIREEDEILGYPAVDQAELEEVDDNGINEELEQTADEILEKDEYIKDEPEAEDDKAVESLEQGDILEDSENEDMEFETEDEIEGGEEDKE